ncbi:MAG: Gfo/Idh/MocA family protein [Halosimplex sp.]
MTYRAGIVGTGGVAGMGIYDGSADDVGTDPVDASHAGGYAAVDDVELAAVADVDPDALERFGRAWEIPEEHRYLGHEAMLEAEDLDIVSVCTPSMLHREHVEDAARIGDPAVVWCEKPVACSVSDAESMVETCEAADVELLVNHSQRFLRQNRAVKAAVDDGLIGEVRSITCGSPMELLRVGTHVVDLALYLADARAETVAGHVTGANQVADDLADSDVDDAATGGFAVLEGGAFLTYDGTARRDEATFHHRINGSDGRLVSAEDGWRYWEATDDGHVEREPPTEGFEDDHERSFVNAVAHAVQLIEGEAENRSPGREARHTLEVLVGFVASDSTGGRVSVPFDRPMKDVTVTSW